MSKLYQILTIGFLLAFSFNLAAQKPVLKKENPIHRISPHSKKAANESSKNQTTAIYTPEWRIDLNWNSTNSNWDSSSFHSFTYHWTGQTLLDSTLIYPSPLVNDSRNEFFYDSQNRNNGYLYQQWNGSNWENSSRSAEVFDGNDNSLIYASLSWNSVGGVWDTTYATRGTFSYDGNNNLLQETYEDWVSNGVYENAYRYTYTYDASGNNLTEIDESWNGSAWENDSKYMYSYNAQNEISEFTSQTWNGTGWDNETHVFNISWHNFANEEALSYTTQFWFGVSWVNDERYTYVYDVNNGFVGQIESFDYIGGTWGLVARETSHRNSFNDQTLHMYENFDGTNWTLDFADSTAFVYDGNGNPLEITGSGNNGGGWENYFRELFGDYSVGRDMPNAGISFKPWPNPFTDVLKFEAQPGVVTVFDLNGKQVKQVSISSPGIQNLDIETLPAGMYIMNLNGVSARVIKR